MRNGLLDAHASKMAYGKSQMSSKLNWIQSQLKLRRGATGEWNDAAQVRLEEWLCRPDRKWACTNASPLSIRDATAQLALPAPPPATASSSASSTIISACAPGTPSHAPASSSDSSEDDDDSNDDDNNDDDHKNDEDTNNDDNNDDDELAQLRADNGALRKQVAQLENFHYQAHMSFLQAEWRVNSLEAVVRSQAEDLAELRNWVRLFKSMSRPASLTA